MPRWHKSDDVLERRLPVGVLLLPVGGDDITLLAGTGGQLWSLLTETRGIEELTDALAHRYDGSENTIRSDVEAVLAALERSGLVGREA
jgi:hypothetical protein